MPVFTRTLPFSGTAIDLLEIFQDEKNLFLLDSSLTNTPDGQYSYLGFSPFKTIHLKNFKQLRAALKPYWRANSSEGFSGGAVGSINYEGDLNFSLYEGVICIDHRKKQLILRSSIQKKIQYILRKLQNPAVPRRTFKSLSQKLFIQNDSTPQQYISAVKKALQHIHDGDIYQINLTHRLEARIKNWQQYSSPVEIYKNLRLLSPSAFSAYLDDGKQVILSSSPERFLRLTNGIAQVKPMKGTRPRSTNNKEDRENKEDLIQSAKEKAELLMVTDLERNDLGRVCQYGSVKVKAMRTIEEYATVFQATSTIEGILRKDCDPFDLLESTFPSGSVTGCPKIEAMKLIKALERSPRAAYTGSLGYIGFNGDMDFNVLIRTLFLKRDHISFSVGSGIVADSNPKREYEETMVKSKAMVQALRESFQGQKRTSTACKDGFYVQLTPQEIETFTPGIFKGEGVFETMLAVGNKVFDVKEHLKRLKRSVKEAQITPDIIQKVVEANGFDMARVRVLAWKEKGKKASHTAVMALPYIPQQKDIFKVCLMKTNRPASSRFANKKSLNYQLFAKAYAKARAQGFDEVLLINQKGYIFEASRANVFIIKEGQLITPPLSSGCLNGITRQQLIKAARKLGIPVKETPVSLDLLQSAHELFLTNSLIGVQRANIFTSLK